MTNIFFLLSYLSLVILTVFFIKESKTYYHIKKENNMVYATIKNVPKRCSRNNLNIMDVEVNSNIYSARISRGACRKKRYAVNQKIKIYYSKKYDDVVMLYTRVNLHYNMAKICAVITIIIPFVVLWRFWLNWSRINNIRKSLPKNKSDEEVRSEIKRLKKKFKQP